MRSNTALNDTYGIIKRPSHEELEGQIIGTLAWTACVMRLSIVPVELRVKAVRLQDRHQDRDRPPTSRLSRTESAAA